MPVPKIAKGGTCQPWRNIHVRIGYGDTKKIVVAMRLFGVRQVSSFSTTYVQPLFTICAEEFLFSLTRNYIT